MYSGCGHNGAKMIITPSNYTDIHSPEFPEYYPSNLNCKWHIKADDGYQIELHIKGYELEDGYMLTDIVIHE